MKNSGAPWDVGRCWRCPSDNFHEKSLPVLALLLAAVCCLPTQAQTDPISAAKQLFEQERWSELAQLLQPTIRNSADLAYYYGVALAHLEHWREAISALSAGQWLAPNDKRFPIELAGVAFKQKKDGEAKQYLHRALRLDPTDEYANEFLATIYFLQGNLEAALKYWNRIRKPKVAEVPSEPGLKVRPALLDHAFAFAPASTLTLDELLASNVRLRGLEIFPTYKLNLEARPDGKFDATFRAQELNGFGNGKLQALVRIFSGALFEEITPEYYNLHGSAPILFHCSALIPISAGRWPRSMARWLEIHNGATAWAPIFATRTGRCKRLSPALALSWARRIFAVKAWARRFRGLLARAGPGQWAWSFHIGIFAMLFPVSR